MILRLTENLSDCEQTFKTVFGSFDPFEPIVHEGFPIRKVLFPTESYHLDHKQFGALLAATASREEKKFYVSEIESMPSPFVKGSHWFCDDPSFSDYTHLPIGVENAIYSLDGTWGFLLSHELHAFLACDEDFWSNFEVVYPNWRNDEAEFIDYWREAKSEGTKTDWLPNFLGLLNASG